MICSKRISPVSPNIFIFTLLFNFCIFQLCPQETAEADIIDISISREITDLEVIGLKRTKPHIARYALEKFLGVDGKDLDLNEVHAVIKSTGVLEPIEVILVEKENGLLLQVTVEEKWSIFPVPIVIATNGEFGAGLFFMDANALGIRDQMVLGGMYRSSGWTGMAMYNHVPSGHKGLPGWNALFMYGRQDTEDTDRDEEVFRRYSIDQLRAHLGLNYPFANDLSASVSLSFADISLKNNKNPLNPPEKGARILSLSPGLSKRSSSWDGYLLSQRNLSLGYSYNFAISGSSFHQAEFRGVWEQPIIPGFRVNLKSGMITKSSADPNTDLLFEDNPGRAQVDILPRNFSARHYAGFSAGLEKYLVKTRWGTLSALTYWQAVFSKGPISGFEFDNGPSAGIRFYLSRIALPAMGGNLAYNINSGRFQFSFSIGMEF